MPDDDVRDTVLLRPGVGVAGTEPGMPEVVSAEVVVVGLKKQVNRRFSRRLATSFICKRNNTSWWETTIDLCSEN